MSRKYLVTVSAPAGASSTDDLTLIRSIGPAIESHLHDVGIRTFVQIADRSPEELAALLHGHTGLSAQQIAKKDWIDQARRLVSTANLDEPQSKASKRASAAGKVTFTVQLRVDGNNNVRKTHVTYVQDGSDDEWPGWDEAKLVEFFVRRAGLQLVAAEPGKPDTAAAEPLDSAAPTGDLGGLPGLNELVAIGCEADDRSRLVRHGQPFEMWLGLDLSKVGAPGDTALDYSATIYARRLRTGERESIRQVTGAANPGGEVILNTRGAELPQGVYRLEAAVSLVSPTAQAESRQDISTLLEGSLLYVY